MNIQGSEYFTEDELACNCGCGKNTLNEDLLKLAERARQIADIPFSITSWNRCTDRNINEGGSATSSHLTGYAVDIRFNHSQECFVIVQALISAGFVRVGISKAGKFVHADVDKNKGQEVLFLY